MSKVIITGLLITTGLLSFNISTVICPEVVAKTDTVDTGPPCGFPAPVRGHWLDFRGRRYTVKEASVDQLGPCIHNQEDTYIIHARSHNCDLCFHLVQRHFNALQLTVECDPVTPQKSNRTTCEHGQYHLPGLLLRESHVPIPCPFRENYKVEYANHSNVFCAHEETTATPCAAKGDYSFHFKRCPGMPTTFNVSIQMRCVAQWMARGGIHLLVRMGPENSSDEITPPFFHCMRYYKKEVTQYLEKFSEQYCGGPVAMVIKMAPPVTSKSLDQRCSLPVWFGTDHWRDLSGRLAVSGESRSQSIYLEWQESSARKVTMATRLFCLNILQLNSTRLVSLMRVVHGCQIGRQCFEIKRRLRDVFEIRLGPLSDEKLDRCPDTEFIQREVSSYLIFPDSLVGTPCPLEKGHYKMLGPQSENCTLSVQSQCTGTSHLALYYRCKHATTVVRFSCLKHWTIGPKTRVIVRQTDDNFGMSNCLLIRQRRDHAVVSLDKSCNVGVPSLLKGIRRFKITAVPGVCRDIKPVHQIQQADRGKSKKICDDACSSAPVADGKLQQTTLDAAGKSRATWWPLTFSYILSCFLQ